MEKIFTGLKYCGNCNKTDGAVYASLPAKVRCTVTGQYRYTTDCCNCETETCYDAENNTVIPTAPEGIANVPGQKADQITDGK